MFIMQWELFKFWIFHSNYKNIPLAKKLLDFIGSSSDCDSMYVEFEVVY